VSVVSGREDASHPAAGELLPERVAMGWDDDELAHGRRRGRVLVRADQPGEQPEALDAGFSVSQGGRPLVGSEMTLEESLDRLGSRTADDRPTITPENAGSLN